MSLKKDLSEARELWRESSSIFKLFIIISIFMTFSSFASMSDEIYKWKGFVADGLHFYRSSLIAPLDKILAYFKLTYSQISKDYLVVYSLSLIHI